MVCISFGLETSLLEVYSEDMMKKLTSRMSFIVYNGEAANKRERISVQSKDVGPVNRQTYTPWNTVQPLALMM